MAYLNTERAQPDRDDIDPKNLQRCTWCNEWYNPNEGNVYDGAYDAEFCCLSCAKDFRAQMEGRTTRADRAQSRADALVWGE